MSTYCNASGISRVGLSQKATNQRGASRLFLDLTPWDGMLIDDMLSSWARFMSARSARKRVAALSKAFHPKVDLTVVS